MKYENKSIYERALEREDFDYAGVVARSIVSSNCDWDNITEDDLADITEEQLLEYSDKDYFGEYYCMI